MPEVPHDFVGPLRPGTTRAPAPGFSSRDPFLARGPQEPARRSSGGTSSASRAAQERFKAEQAAKAAAEEKARKTAESAARFKATQEVAKKRSAQSRARVKAREEESRKIIRREELEGEVQIAPEASFIRRQQRERERLRTKKERGMKLTLKEEGILAGKTIIQGVSEFGVGIIALPKTLIDVAKNPSQLKNIPSSIARGGEKFGQLLRTSPTEAFVKIGTEIFLLKGSTKALKITGKVSSNVATKLSPKFRGLKKGAITVPSQVKGKTVDIKIGGPVSKIKEPLKKQAALAGKRTTAVSAQADRLVNLIKRKRIVRKPIPNEAKLSASTKRLLKQFDEGSISKKSLINLDQRIRIETKGQGNILERSFFADPRGRARPSRLGLKQKDASLLDILSGDVTFKTNKPQILIFEDIKVQAFPKSLDDVAKKLKSGKTLTASQSKRLIQFQTKKSGKFKPIGALSKEPEITLAPGEIVKRIKTSAVTIIDGRRVPIVRAKVVRATKETQKLLKKSKAGKITSKEIGKLTKNLKKETGFTSSLSRSTKVRPRARVGVKFPKRRPTTRKPKARKPTVRKPKARKPVRRKPVVKPVRRPTIRRQTARRPVRRKPKIRKPRVPTRPKKPRRPVRPPKRPPKIPRRPRRPRRPGRPGRPPAKPPVRLRISKRKRRPKRPQKKKAYNVRAKPIKTLAGKKAKRSIKVNRVPLTKTRARDLRNYVTDTSLSRTASIRATKGKPKKPVLKVPRKYAAKTRPKFRKHRIVKGKRVPLRKGKVIERKTRLLDTMQEKNKITLRRRIKQITPKRKPVRRKAPVRRRSTKRIKRRQPVRRQTMRRKARR